MKNYKEKKPAKRFFKSTKPLSKGDQKMKEYHDKPVHEKMQEANPLMVPEGEQIGWSTCGEASVNLATARQRITMKMSPWGDIVK